MQRADLQWLKPTPVSSLLPFLGFSWPGYSQTEKHTCYSETGHGALAVG